LKYVFPPKNDLNKIFIEKLEFLLEGEFLPWKKFNYLTKRILVLTKFVYDEGLFN
jgi:hypothetical protein